MNYLKTQEKKQKQYDEHIQNIADSFKNGDIVGSPISKVDRTNCEKKIIPCLVEERIDKDNMPMFRLRTPFGQLDTLYAAHQLVPMSGIQPSILEGITFDNTNNITLVQASKLFARRTSTATCDCKTKCHNKLCPCRRANINCSTKCHTKLGKYSNNDTTAK